MSGNKLDASLHDRSSTCLELLDGDVLLAPALGRRQTVALALRQEAPARRAGGGNGLRRLDAARQVLLLVEIDVVWLARLRRGLGGGFGFPASASRAFPTMVNTSRSTVGFPLARVLSADVVSTDSAHRRHRSASMGHCTEFTL